MRIGLVYDLRDDYLGLGLEPEHLAEFDAPETLQALEGAMQAMGHETVRIGHVRDLATALVAGARWDLVFNIAEGLRGRSREAQVPGLLEAYGIPYVFSDPLALALSLDKSLCKRLVRAVGIPTAPFVVLDDEEDVQRCSMAFPLFLKPVAEGSGKGCSVASRVMNREELVTVFRRWRARFAQPVLVEPYLPGREFTVAIVGNGSAIALHVVAEIRFESCGGERIYTLDNKQFSSERVRYVLVDDPEARMAREHALTIYHLLGCRDAARLDFRSDEAGVPQFLEINPLAGLHPTLSGLPLMAGMLGWSYECLIQTMVQAAWARQG